MRTEQCHGHCKDVQNVHRLHEPCAGAHMERCRQVVHATGCGEAEVELGIQLAHLHAPTAAKMKTQYAQNLTVRSATCKRITHMQQRHLATRDVPLAT